MNLTDYFKNVPKGQKACKLRDLIVLAYADRHFTDDERAFVATIMRDEGLDATLIPTIYKSPESIPDFYPTTKEGKEMYLYDMVLLMITDGECSEREIKYCEVIAWKMGLDDEAVSRTLGKIVVRFPDENQQISLILDYLANGGKMPTRKK